jgi:hypothetical protein
MFWISIGTISGMALLIYSLIDTARHETREPRRVEHIVTLDPLPDPISAR